MHNLSWHSYQNLSLGNKMHDMQEKGYQATYSAVYCYNTNTHLGLEPLALRTSLSLCQQKHKTEQNSGTKLAIL